MEQAPIAAGPLEAIVMGILPCPFCGGKAHFDHDDNGWNWIQCGQCQCSTTARVSAMDDCRPLLAEAWNRRSPLGEPVAFEAREIGESDWYRVGLDEKERIKAIIKSPTIDYRWLFSQPHNAKLSGPDGAQRP